MGDSLSPCTHLIIRYFNIVEGQWNELCVVKWVTAYRLTFPHQIPLFNAVHRLTYIPVPDIYFPYTFESLKWSACRTATRDNMGESIAPYIPSPNLSLFNAVYRLTYIPLPNIHFPYTFGSPGMSCVPRVTAAEPKMSSGILKCSIIPGRVFYNDCFG